VKNAEAIELFDKLYINVLRKELDPNDEQYQNLKNLLEAGLRSCVICERCNDQGDMIEAFTAWAHVDCAHEYHQESLVDPTVRHIGESDADYEVRMERDFPDL
jgi:hypothetical protein